MVSGYLSGVGLIIIGSQLPKFAGAPADTPWLDVLINPQHWDWRQPGSKLLHLRGLPCALTSNSAVIFLLSQVQKVTGFWESTESSET